MDRPEKPLTRDDFPDWEAWAKHCHLCGVDLVVDGYNEDLQRGTGYYSALTRAIVGHDRIQYAKAIGIYRKNDGIELAALQALYRAVAFANCRGAILDTWITVTWSLHGIITDEDVAERQGVLLALIRKWLIRNNSWPAYAWVLERGALRGLHTHMIIHIPNGLTAAFKAYFPEMLSRVVRGPLVTTGPDKTMMLEVRRGVRCASQWYAFKYMVKGMEEAAGWATSGGVNPFVTARAQAKLRKSAQGVIAGKRTGISQALGEATFKAFAAINEFPDMVISADEQVAYDDRFILWFYSYGESPKLRLPEALTKEGTVRKRLLGQKSKIGSRSATN